jgi:hypothetical protein
VLVGLEVIVGEVADAELAAADLDVAEGVGVAVSRIDEAVAEAEAEAARTLPTLVQKPLSSAIAE